MFRFERDALRVQSETAFVEQRSIRFQDVDAAGIIFYPRLLVYCHDLLVSFLARAGAPLDQVLRDGHWIAPIRHAEADYFKPLRFGDVVDVALVRVHLEAREATLGFRFARAQGGEVCAVAQSVHAFLDPATFTRIDVPEPPRSAFAAIGE
jgi:1,4-dihydroxy-2-naphthoyl-CoA hydrolase